MPLQITNQPVRFRAEGQQINYNQPQPQIVVAPTQDMFFMERMQQQMAKKENSREKWNKAGVIAQALIGAGIIGSALITIWATKFNAKEIKNVDKGLHAVKINWEDFANNKKVTPLNSETTAEELKNAFNNIINTRSLSEKARKWGGSKADKANIMYIYGHGGTGKTYIAQQYAQETNAMYTCIKYPDIGSSFKDGAAARISNFFNGIKEFSEEQKKLGKKVVVCIDEGDTIVGKIIEGTQWTEDARKSRGAVLTGLDLIKNCDNLTVIMTSNYHPESGLVDSIAMRRFNNLIEAPLGKAKQNLAMMKLYLKDVGAIIDSKFLESSQAMNFARKLEQEGYSNGEIELICEEASKIFSATLKDVADSDLSKHPFKVEYLEQAMKAKGAAASKTNNLMNIRPNSQSTRNNLSMTHAQTNIPQTMSIWQKIKNWLGLNK